MEGIYIEHKDCLFYLERGLCGKGNPCIECIEKRKHKAKILQYGIGEKHNQMVVLLDNGIIKTVNDYEIKDIKE